MIRLRTAALAAGLCSASVALALSVQAAQAAAGPLGNDCSAGYVAFTFDDGPGANTPAVIQALQSLNLEATFFVNGNKLDASATSQQVLRDEIAAGFGVQNHTYDHASFTGASTGAQPLTEAQVTAELENPSTAIVNAGGPKPTLYRPPYGDVNAYYDLIAQNLGYRIVMPWARAGNVVDSQDWTGISAAEIASN